MNMQEKKKKDRKAGQPVGMPTTAEFEAELEHERRREQTRHTLRNTIFALLTAAAAAVLVATLIFPVFRIYGTSMTPTLTGGDVVMAVKTSKLICNGHCQGETSQNHICFN
jgi:hypothetical protein